MKVFSKIFLFIIALPLLYFIGSLITSYLPVNSHDEKHVEKPYVIFLHSNGVHLDVAVNKNDIPTHMFNGLYTEPKTQFVSFGWGEENFYLNTPEWKNLTVKNGFKAMFINSSSLMHITRYTEKQSDWISISVSQMQYQKLMHEIAKSFKMDNNEVMLILGISYTNQDEFYKANGSYHLFHTCNSWVSRIFKNSGIKACLWTPFDFALMQHHQD